MLSPAGVPTAAFLCEQPWKHLLSLLISLLRERGTGILFMAAPCSVRYQTFLGVQNLLFASLIFFPALLFYYHPESTIVPHLMNVLKKSISPFGNVMP